MTDEYRRPPPRDPEPSGQALIDEKRKVTLIRGLFMLLFSIIYSVAEVVLAIVVLLQFSFVLVSRERNYRLLEFGAQVSTFIYQVLRYVTFNSDERPFPFADWPSTAVDEPD